MNRILSMQSEARVAPPDLHWSSPRWRMGPWSAVIGQVASAMLCLALAVSLLAMRFAGSNCPLEKGSSAADFKDGPPLLDSFSEPGMACAIPSGEIDRLWWSTQIARANANACSQEGQSEIQSLTALELQVEDLAVDLNLDLIGIDIYNSTITPGTQPWIGIS